MPRLPVTPRAVRIRDAARILRRSPRTLRRWLQQGAPAIEPGVVDPAALAQWYTEQRLGPPQAQAEQLSQLAAWLHDYHRRDAGLGVPAHAAAGLTAAQAATHSALFWRYAHIRLTGCEPEQRDYPTEILDLLRVAERGHK